MKQLGSLVGLRGVRMPFATVSSVSRCFSSSEPSHHTMRSGLVRRAISSTQSRRCWFLVNGFPAASVGVGIVFGSFRLARAIVYRCLYLHSRVRAPTTPLEGA